MRAVMQSIVGSRSGQKAQITLPNADGNLEQFEIVEASNFEPALQARFPEIRAYSGRSLSRPGSTLKISLDGESVQSMVFRPGDVSEYIEPYSADKKVYAVFRRERPRGQSPWVCSTQDKALVNGLNNRVELMARGGSDGVLRTMRLAQSCNGEYSNYFGATSTADVSKVMAAFNNTLTRCNGVYEKDLGLHLNLIPETVKVIFYNPSTDPYTRMSSWNNQLQSTLTANIGEANYDIGHMFGASGGGGNAGCIGCVCVDGSKGRGITSPADRIPEGDNFDIDYVAHEVGHQLGANHTFSMSNEGTGVNKEVGSGITVMGYAGITSQDVANHSIDIFHQASIGQIQANLSNKGCVVKTDAKNTAPVVSLPGNYTIPKSTPFQLTGSATDDLTNGLTFCWEQNDNSTTTGTGSVASETKATGPNWITFPATSSPTRLFPRLSTILAGSRVTGPLAGGDAGANTEALSSVARTLNFRLTVRDNVPYSSATPTIGQTGYEDAVITVDGNSGPFAVTAPNTAVNWSNGTTQTVTWSVNNTNLSPINCSKVNILLSTDGGITFPITLVSGTDNDGSESINLNVSGTLPLNKCRIKIEAVGNIFFDIGNADFTISNPPACGTPTALSTTGLGNTTATISWSAVTDAVSYTASYKAASSSAWTILGNLTVLSQNLTGLTAGTLYDWNVVAICSGGAGNPATAQFTTTGGQTCPNPLDKETTNGSITGAQVIPLNTDVMGKVSPKNDIDYYKFTITTGGTITISLTNLPADYDLRLYNSTGTLLASSAKSGTTAESIAYTASAGTYYAHVSGYRGANNSTSCYILKIATGTASRMSDLQIDDSGIQSENIKIYPNPTANLLIIEASWVDGPADVTILNTQGRSVLNSIVNEQENSIDLTSLPSGLYLVRIRTGSSKLHTSKVIKN